MRVSVDPNVCQAYANCVTFAPAVFELDDARGVAVVRTPEPPHELHDAVEQAIALCPTRAISATYDQPEAASRDRS
jgi:ferredoxin